MAKTGKIVEVLFEQALETYEHQMQMLNLVERFTPDAGSMQNSGVGGQNTGKFGGGVIWRPTQQHAPVIEGWDMTGEETDIIEETYPAVLTPPKNDIYKQSADDMRDMQFWERRGRESGKKQATYLNSAIANAIMIQGSVFYETASADGFGAIGEAQTMLNETQKAQNQERFCVLNDRSTLKYAKELAGRETVKGRPEDAWAKGQIGSGVAEFDLYTGSFLPTLDASSVVNGGITGLSGGTLSNGGESFIPEGGTVDPVSGAVTNVDYRTGIVTVTDATGLAVGSKITISGVNAVGMADKNDTGRLMTFTVVNVATNALTIYPKPISLSLTELTSPEQNLHRAYANCTGDVSAGTVAVLNANGGKLNIFGAKDSVEVLTGEAPIALLNEFGGMKVISSTMSNGQTMYMAYDGDLLTMNFTCRLFTWYGITIADPSGCGSFITI